MANTAVKHICNHSVMVNTSLNRYDPTRTTVLRNRFATDMKRRFRKLRASIKQAIVDQDVLGLKQTVYASPPKQAFIFETTAGKVEKFMTWLKQQTEKEILAIREYQQVGASAQNAWTNMYIGDSYKRGVIRARYEMGKAGFPVSPLESTGGIAASMGTPFHADRVGLMYTRAFEELKGITTAMDTQISRVLSQGMVDGDAPGLLAKKLMATASGPIGDLGITDAVGRFIPAERRAAMLARTEVIRAHHSAMVQEYRNWEVEGVKVKAEWSTAGYDVCELCLSLEGKEFTLDQIQNMIPRHPNCRCIALPLDVTEKVGKVKGIIDTPKPVSTPTVPVDVIAPARSRTLTKKSMARSQELRKVKAESIDSIPPPKIGKDHFFAVDGIQIRDLSLDEMGHPIKGGVSNIKKYWKAQGVPQSKLDEIFKVPKIVKTAPKPTPAPKAPVKAEKITRTTPAPKTAPKTTPAPKTAPKTAPEWKTISNTDNVFETLKSQLSEYNVDLTGKIPGLTAAQANVIGNEFHSIFSKFPEIWKSAILKSNKVKLVFDRSLTSATETMGLYHPRTSKIALSPKLLKNTAPELRIGNTFVVSDDLASVIRHEYGHHVHLSVFNKGKYYETKYTKWKDSIKQWIKPREFYTDWDTYPYMERVSNYATTSFTEAFAECFSAWTSPLYGKAGARLPKAIEEIMESIVGSRRF